MGRCVHRRFPYAGAANPNNGPSTIHVTAANAAAADAATTTITTAGLVADTAILTGNSSRPDRCTAHAQPRATVQSVGSYRSIGHAPAHHLGGVGVGCAADNHLAG